MKNTEFRDALVAKVVEKFPIFGGDIGEVVDFVLEAARDREGWERRQYILDEYEKDKRGD